MLAMGIFGYLGDYVLWWVLFLSLVLHTWCFFRFFPRQKHRKSGLVLGNLLVFACMLGAVAIIGESYYRFICVRTDSFGLSLPAQRWFALYTRVNTLGCRDREWTAGDPPNLRRIACVGDSFTYGWGIEQVTDRFPDRLQAGFDRRSPDSVEVMNVAKPGWGTDQQIRPIVDMIDRYGVDEVLLCYVPNDIERLLPRDDTFNPIVPPQPRYFNPDSSCLLYELFFRLVVPHADTVAGYHDWLAAGFADADIFNAHRHQLAEIIRACAARGVTLRVALLPFLVTGGDTFDTQRVHAQLRAFFHQQGIEVADLSSVLTGRDTADLIVNPLDPHPNEFAHQLFADAIWEAFYASPTP
ncbi:MAG: SGNH/GDSL hydrolase family protein [Phycisphaerae bacterium]|jgi:lysophospholipase L1-like esterase